MKEKLQSAWNKTRAFFARLTAWLKKYFPKAELSLLALGVAVAAIALRFCMFNMRTGDYNSFLVHWFDDIKAGGGFKAMGMSLGDYTPAYYYILAVLTYLPVSSLYSIKAVSCIFDLVLAVFAGLCVKEVTKSRISAFVAYTVTLFLPTVFLNSGWWAQCDSIYTSFCVASLYFLLKDKKYTAVVLYGVAFSFKLQAIFLAPLLAVLWFKRKIPLASPLIILGVYFLFCVPSWIAGRDLWELLTIYFVQAGEYSKLTLNAPTFVALLGNVKEDAYGILSSVFVILTLCVTVVGMYLCGRKTEWKKESFIDFGLLFALGVPFFLPRMHERYFYLADILALLYAFTRPKRMYTAILTEFCSFYVICRYLYGMPYLSLETVALIQLVNLTLLIVGLCGTYAKTSLPLTESRAPTAFAEIVVTDGEGEEIGNE